MNVSAGDMSDWMRRMVCWYVNRLLETSQAEPSWCPRCFRDSTFEVNDNLNLCDHVLLRLTRRDKLNGSHHHMSNTTQILFNSPALHSLKRDQLLKLCKIHSIKATGKNVELIEKLKHHALTLPKDAPLSIATRSEVPLDTNELSEFGDQSSYQRSRPSEQWEVVMDSIEEKEEASSAQGSLNSLKTIGKDKSTGEFGTTGGSMCTFIHASISPSSISS